MVQAAEKSRDSDWPHTLRHSDTGHTEGGDTFRENTVSQPEVDELRKKLKKCRENLRKSPR